ncbi:MAG TPA: multiheme c-type cytochrome [Thermoanaerobaculia bacterium]|nr:multiheme c-type cytochrome [Thermoanaerobaculia bacterium]
MNSPRRTFALAIPSIIFLAVMTLGAATKPAHKKAAPKAPDLGKSEACVACHDASTPGIVAQWRDSGHAKKGIGCYDCHQAGNGRADAFDHYGETIAVVITPRDCARCHKQQDLEFENSHHAKAGNILASLDNYLAEIVEGARIPFNPHSPTPGKDSGATVNGLASAQDGCQQCHGAKVALRAKEGVPITFDDLKPSADGNPTNSAAVDRIARDDQGRPIYMPATWPNTGIGRLNLDGSRGSCTACHSRHDFSPRRARQPENCGKCHLGPDHPQKEIYDESKHGIAYRDLRDKMNLDAKSWVLGKDYSQAPTCATCHMSATASGLGVTHDPGERISWTNRPPISLVMDTDADHKVITESDPIKRKALIADSAEQKRDRMKLVCGNCHTSNYVNSFYNQYDDFVVLFNEKFAKPGTAIMNELYGQGLLTKKQFDERIEWDWYFLWHHEGRRARHGASMMAPDYTHWHGMYEVADRFYMSFIPEAREIARKAAESGKKEQAGKVNALIDSILARPEHAWYGTSAPASPTDPAPRTPK